MPPALSASDLGYYKLISLSEVGGRLGDSRFLLAQSCQLEKQQGRHE